MNVLMWCITHLCPTKNDLVMKEVQTKGASLRTQYVTLSQPKARGSGDKDVTSRQRGILNSLEFLGPHVLKLDCSFIKLFKYFKFRLHLNVKPSNHNCLHVHRLCFNTAATLVANSHVCVQTLLLNLLCQSGYVCPL